MLIYISPPISHYVHTRAYFIQLREEMWPVGADTKRNHTKSRIMWGDPPPPSYDHYLNLENIRGNAGECR